jgi:hypothetical protein
VSERTVSTDYSVPVGTASSLAILVRLPYKAKECPCFPNWSSLEARSSSRQSKALVRSSAQGV